MTEHEWLASTDPAAMLRFLVPHRPNDRVGGQFPSSQFSVSDRKLRLFACGCCRQVWDGLPCPRCDGVGRAKWVDTHWSKESEPCPECHGTGRVGGPSDPRSRKAVEAAEQYADGKIGADVITAMHVELGRPVGAAACVASADFAAREVIRAGICPPATQAALLRDIFGNPFRPKNLSHRWGDLHHEFPGAAPKATGWLTWHNGIVPRIAQRIYDEQRWQDMPILADALLDAGCDDEEMLMHCRGQERCPCDPPLEFSCTQCWGTHWRPLAGPHVRGCWVLDLILGKE